MGHLRPELYAPADGNWASLRQSLSQIALRLDTIENYLNQLDARLDSIELRLSQLETP